MPFLFLALLLGAVRASPAAAQAPAARPNIVFIMADDLGYGDVGVYGQTKIRTPRLDRMAREGTRFTQFYAGSPVCAPSRSALMTGQHTGHTYIRGNKEHPAGQEPLPDHVTTVADVLKQAGYTTGTFGKWGLGGVDTEGTPMRHGFDEFFGYHDQRRAHFYYPEYLHQNAAKVSLPNRVREEPRSPGAGPAVVRGRYSHDAIAEEALAFLERHHREPFFLYLPFTIPHAELQAPDDAYGPYVENGRSIFPETPFAEKHYGAQAMPRATYAAMVSRLDRDVGRILDKLGALGLDRNTIVFFTSDNGPSVEGGSDPDFFDSNGPLRGFKRDVYEGGIRVPMIVWGPGRIPAARTSDQVWALWDVLPTLAELAGAKAPAGIDGISMVPSLTGQGSQRQHDSLYWEFFEQGSKQAVRMGRWGVRQPMLTGKLEVYDLEADPGETRDVASAHPAAAAGLARLLDEAHTPSAPWKAPAEEPSRSQAGGGLGDGRRFRLQVAWPHLGEGGQPLAQAAGARGFHEDLRHATAVQDGDVGEALRAAHDPDLRVALEDRARDLRRPAGAPPAGLLSIPASDMPTLAITTPTISLPSGSARMAASPCSNRLRHMPTCRLIWRSRMSRATASSMYSTPATAR